MVGMSAGKGISKLLLKRWPQRAKQGKSIAAVVLPDLLGQGPVRKEAFLMTSIFGYF
jgi:hypothetical protein